MDCNFFIFNYLFPPNNRSVALMFLCHTRLYVSDTEERIKTTHNSKHEPSLLINPQN